MGAVRVSGVRLDDNLYDYQEGVAPKRKGNRKNDKLSRERRINFCRDRFISRDVAACTFMQNVQRAGCLCNDGWDFATR